MAFLSAVRVLDLADHRGLMAGRMLADLGADVVQVEPPKGNEARQRAPYGPDGTSLYWDAYGANRRGAVADPGADGGAALIRALAEQADILIESAGPGVLAGLGLGWEDLRHRCPALIYVSITAFGATGPKAGYAESDLVVWAAGGPLDPHRDGDRAPLRISVPQAYLHAGADAAGGALIALAARAATGRGQLVEVSAQASLSIATLGTVLGAAIDPRVPPSGSAAPATAAGGPRKWACKDGVIEFGLGIGPAVGGFTLGFVTWMLDEQAIDREVLEIEWRTAPASTPDGPLTEERLDTIRAAVAAFLLTKTKAEVLAAAVERKLLCVPVYDTNDARTSVQLKARDYWTEVGVGARRRTLSARFAVVTDAAQPPFSVTRPAPLLGEHDDEVRREWLGNARRDPAQAPAAAVPGRSRADAPGPGALSGLRVLDLSWVVAGPVIGRALADFGAEVIRVESSTKVETARHMPPHYGGLPGPENSALYVSTNAGKLGVTVDLQTDEGRAIVRALAAASDVVLESFAPGLLARWGLDYPELSSGRDDLIMLSTSLMGQSGPLSRLAGFGNVGAALSGFQDIGGWADRPAVGPLGPYTDYLGPRLSIATLLAALDERRRTGRGCWIDVSQIEAGLYFQGPEMADNALTGAIVTRMGNADRDFAPHGVYACQPEDGVGRYVAVAICTDAQWLALATAISRNDLAQRADLRTVAGRRAAGPELDGAIEAWTANRAPVDAEALLQRAGVPAHGSASSADWCADPQLQHIGHLVRLPSEAHGEALIEAPRYRLSGTPGVVRSPAPTFGRDNERVLGEVLGYSVERIRDLTERGILR
ncbi:MAG: subunit of succinyl-CoA:benzylsuccinate CoA-transferase [Pseudonocardiales bacterium]|nr:subunit of succinyl-CoA:benzylsuccinate CoA-transferase [Pseudonocardiales bacterium]